MTRGDHGAASARRADIRAAAGLTAAVAGIGLLVTGGLYDPAATGGVPLTALGLFVGGLGALGVIRSHPPLEASAPIDPAPAADPRGDR